MVYGFTTKVIALQFEWQWTYPRKSRRMRGLMELRKWGGGVRGKVELLYQLLQTLPWSSMPLHVRFNNDEGWKVHLLIAARSERERKDWGKKSLNDTTEEKEATLQRRHIYTLPSHISLTVGPLEELEVYRWIKQRRGRQKRREASALDDPSVSVTPRGDDDDPTLFDDEAVSGEESLNSGDSDEDTTPRDDADPSDEDLVLSSPVGSSRTLGRSGEGRGSHGKGEGARLSPQGQGVERLRCGICFGSAELGDVRSAHFFSGCDHCTFVGHLVCIAQLIFRQMESATRPPRADTSTFPSTQPTLPPPSPPLSSPHRSSSLASGSGELASASMFSSVSASLPLIPPPGKGQCPTCHASWSWPLLVDRCRFMHVDGKGRRGGDVWYEEADDYTMAPLVRLWAGRGGEDKKRKREEEKQEKEEKKTERKKKTAERKAATSSVSDDLPRSSAREAKVLSPRAERGKKGLGDSDSDASTSVHDSDECEESATRATVRRMRPNKENEGKSESRSPPRVKKPTVSRRVEMHDGLARPLMSSAPSLFSSSQPNLPSATSASASRADGRSLFKGVVTLSDFEEDDDDEGEVREVLDAASQRRRLITEAVDRRLGSPRNPVTSDVTSSQQRRAVVDPEVVLTAHRKVGGGEEWPIGRAEEEEESKKWVRLDEDEEDESAISSAVYTEIDEEEENDVVVLSLAERLKSKAQSAGLGSSLNSIR